MVNILNHRISRTYIIDTFPLNNYINFIKILIITKETLYEVFENVSSMNKNTYHF